MSMAKRRPPASRRATRTAPRKRKAKISRRTRSTPKPSRLAAAVTLVRGAAKGAFAAIARQLPWSTAENDPVVLLETDHRRFEQLLKLGEETTERAVKRRSQLLGALTSELSVHELIEERVLYPALKPYPEAREIVLEGFQEHHVADVLVAELRRVARDDEKWGAKFKVLKESLEHHIEEEESRMFRIARAVLGQEELNDLGARMKALKAELEE
jgi:hemerythrin-like domain-containing protein